MKFRKLTSLAATLCVTASVSGIGAVSADTRSITAFPGAEGGGMWTTGARGSSEKEVYHVTSLEDSGKGTLRDAVSQSDRIIVFDVAGNIELVNALNIVGSNLTILGQTAPGDGVCIKNQTTSVIGSNVIIRYLRFRMGDSLDVENDSIGGRGLNNVILDHCSISWCVDECASFYDNENFTMQWCIVSESLKESVHDKGSHGYGGIWGGRNVSYHHNLIADHDSRNPRIATAGIEAAFDDVTKQTDLTDLRNNVIYNWGGNSAYGGENGAPVNIVNCYYKYGPATASGKRSRIFEISAKKEGDTSTGTDSLNRPGWGTDLYVSGNYVYGDSEVSADNTKGVAFDGNTTSYGLWTDENITEDEKLVHTRYEADYPVVTQTAQDAFEAVLSGAGASIARDSVDERLVREVREGTASCGNNGLINTPSEAGGYPELAGAKAKDSDNDGIPNEWEDLNGLDKFDAADGTALASDGYMYIEKYAGALADGSYTRNTDYDPDVPDYEPEEEPDSTPNPSETRQKELVSEWIASAEDLDKPAGSELMPGLTNVIQLTRPMTNVVTFSDGTVCSYAITHKDTSGSWDKTNKTAAGTALKFAAPCDGVFTLYGYSVSGTKTFYVVPEGASDPDAECIYSTEVIGDSVPILYSVEMNEGDTFCFYIAGSKMRFCAAKYERYIEAAPDYELGELREENGKISFAVTKNADNTDGAAAVAAYYDEYGALAHTETVSVSLAKGEAKTYTVERVRESGESVRVFLWKSVDGQLPLTKSVSLN